MTDISKGLMEDVEAVLKRIVDGADETDSGADYWALFIARLTGECYFLVRKYGNKEEEEVFLKDVQEKINDLVNEIYDGKWD